MAKRKENRADLVSEAGTRYPIEKSSAKKSIKMRLKKYCRKLRKHVWFEEKKQARAS